MSEFVIGVAIGLAVGWFAGGFFEARRLLRKVRDEIVKTHSEKHR